MAIRIRHRTRPPARARLLPQLRGIFLSSLLSASLTYSPTDAQIRWTRAAANPVLRTGGAGSWDGSLVVFPAVVNLDSTYVMWYGGDDGQKYRTGCARSPDGMGWIKDPENPLIREGPPGSWDDYGAWAPSVIGSDGEFAMWYTGARGGQWEKPYSRWQIGRATSKDGRSWVKDILNPVLPLGPPGSWDGDYAFSPTVIFDGALYHMWYEGLRGSWPSGVSGIGYAVSADGVRWTRSTHNPVLVGGLSGSWDEFGVGHPSVVFDSGWYHMWYTGNEPRALQGTSGIGYAVSRDGIHWKKYPENPVLVGRPGSWESTVFMPSVRREGPLYQMWYSGMSGVSWTSQIGFATAPRASAVCKLDRSIVDFGNVGAGTQSDTVSIVVHNWGFTPLSISSIVQKHLEFSLISAAPLPLTILPFEEIRLGVLFRPVEPGVVLLDTVSLVSNDTEQPVTRLFLRGRGSGPVQAAVQGQMYGVSGPSPDLAMYRIDITSGVTALLAKLSPDPPAEISAFALRPTDRTIYAARSSPSETLVYRISSAFGDLEPAGSIPLAGVTAMAFGSGDILYLIDEEGRLHVTAGLEGAPVLVGWTGVPFTGLAVSPATRILWATSHDSVFTIDTASALATFVGTSGWGTRRSSVTFGPLGTLYGVFDNTLVSISKTTGEATVIGPTGITDLRGIAMRVDIPVSASVFGTESDREWKLFQNYPSPFNPSTMISFSVPTRLRVCLTLLNVLGQCVATLVDGTRDQGDYTLLFDGSGLSSGVYFFQMQSEGLIRTRKTMLVR